MPGNANMYQKYRHKAMLLDRIMAFMQASNVFVDSFVLEDQRYRLSKLNGNIVIEKM